MRRQSRWERRTSLIGGGLVAGIGLLVILGWHTGNTLLLQIHPSFTPMVYNTALGFVLCGIALITVAWGYPSPTAACGVIVAALGIASGMQDTLGVDLGIDQLFVKAYVAAKAPHPGRLAPNTCLCFLLSGAALIIMSLAARRRWWPVAAGLLGSMVAAVALNTVFGYATGIEMAAAWGSLVPMAAHTATGFAIVAFVIVTRAWVEGKDKATGAPAWLPAFLAVGLITGTVFLWQALRTEATANIERMVRREADQLTEALTVYINTQAAALVRMAARWGSMGSISRSAWESDAQLHVADEPGYECIGWADPSGKLCWLVPWEGQETLLGMELASQGRQKDTLNRARELRAARMTGWLDLPVGGQRFLVCVPIFPNEVFAGWIVALFRERVLDGVLKANYVAGDLAMTLSEGGRVAHSRSLAAASAPSWSQTTRFTLLGTTWAMETLPSNAMITRNRSYLPEVVQASGLLAAFLLAFAAHLTLRARLRESQVREASMALEREVGERQAAETKLRGSEERLARIVETIADGIFIVDKEGRITFANATAEKLVGIPRERITERTHDHAAWKITAIDGSPLPPADLPFARVVATGAPVYGIELAVERGDGARVPVSVNAAPLLDSSGAVAGMVASVSDITRRKEVERLKDELVSIVSHELRTPLTSLRGFAELMLKREYGPEKQRQFLTIIHNEAVRLTKLINDFLDIQRLQSGRQAYDFKRVELASLVQEAAAVFDGEGKSHQLMLEIPAALPRVWVDSDRIRQVLSNLISNAIKFSPDGGAIAVGAREEGPGVVVWVRDQGVGIPPEEVPKLFEKFYRVDNQETRKIGGTGLGLAIAREIIEAHHGRVWVESQPGKGSTFFFTLQAPAPLTPRLSMPLEAPAGPSPDILIVEDDTAYATLLREHLEAEGLLAVAANSADLALELAQRLSPRLILLDIHLAGPRDGWDLLMALKAHPEAQAIPIIIISASENLNARGLALAGADYITKPLSEKQLTEAIQRHLPSVSGKRVLVADDDPAFREEVSEWLSGAGGIVAQATDGAEAMKQMAICLPDLLLLDLFMPVKDGFEVLASLREDRRSVNLPVLVVTARDLQPRQRDLVKRKMATLVRKRDVNLAELARKAIEILKSAVPAEEMAK